MTGPTKFAPFKFGPLMTGHVFDDINKAGLLDHVDLGPLFHLPGVWQGEGFNQIWRPQFDNAHFLELNRTLETLEFDGESLGDIKNRGLRQRDIDMNGVRYLQRIKDKDTNEGLHLEPGLWVDVPKTNEPDVPASVARLASIPHGTSIVAQGTSFHVDGPPQFKKADIRPFTIGKPDDRKGFDQERILSNHSDSRTDNLEAKHITQAMVDDPNSVLAAAIAGQNIVSTTVLDVTTLHQPILGGGTANTAFLEGPAGDANANATVVTARFWIEKLDGQKRPTQLQYTQTVLLDFNTLSWPHVTVATLTLQS